VTKEKMGFDRQSVLSDADDEKTNARRDGVFSSEREILRTRAAVVASVV
jgi:hypothetical protein